MEKRNIERDEDAVNAILFGNDVRVSGDLYGCSQYAEQIAVKPHGIDIKAFESNLVKMIDNAETKEDLNSIGLKLNEAIDNKYNINIVDYQFKAARKLGEIYNKLGLKI